jgi:hypothetical protein
VGFESSFLSRSGPCESGRSFSLCAAQDDSVEDAPIGAREKAYENKTGGFRIPRNPPAKRPAAIGYDAFFEASRNAFT